MDLDPETLIHGYLDDQLTDEDLRALGRWLQQDPGHARRFALAVLQHDRLRDRFRTLAAVEESGPASAVERPWRRGARGLLWVAAAVLVACLFVFQNASNRRIQAAEAQLDRLIEAAGRPGDRTYRILAPDHTEAQRPEGAEVRAGSRPPIDGAILHVGGGGRYVLIRRPGTAAAFVTGSNRREAWSVPPAGPVHVSADPSRFRGAVPGEQQDLPFLDLRSSLGRLRDAYALELAARDPDRSIQRLIARKRSVQDRGPREVAIDFDTTTGMLRRMRLDGLPRAHGGPRSLVLELTGQGDLGPRFFEHVLHHAPDRPVSRED